MNLNLGDREAKLSPDRQYRYALWRRWDRREEGRQVLFVMLNPSTADESFDDPTIRRCVGFAKSWGFGSLAVGNLFALRATDPRELRRHADPIGPENNHHLLALMAQSDLVVAAWGIDGNYLGRNKSVRDMWPDWKVLGLTKGLINDGHPKHPLYLPANLQPIPWTQ
jgi:hypothetical protein